MIRASFLLFLAGFLSAQQTDSTFLFARDLFLHKHYELAESEFLRSTFLHDEGNDLAWTGAALSALQMKRFDRAEQWGQNLQGINRDRFKLVFLAETRRVDSLSALLEKSDESSLTRRLRMETSLLKLQAVEPVSVKEPWSLALNRLNFSVQGHVKKSPWTAGFLSLLMPGAGQLYLGRTGDALFAFTMIGLSGYLTWREIDAKRQNTAILSGGIFSAFYLGSAWGAAAGATERDLVLEAKIQESIEQNREQHPLWNPFEESGERE